jgi:hypothetical protein
MNYIAEDIFHDKNDLEYAIEIYFKRKNSLDQILIEKWIVSMVSDKGEEKSQCSRDFRINSNNNSNVLSVVNSNKNPKTYKKYRKVSAVKKVSTLLRTINTYTRFLPAFDLAQKNGFDYILDLKCFFSPPADQNLSNLKKTFKHQIDINIGLISFSVKYVDKNEIFLIEQKMVK